MIGDVGNALLTLWAAVVAWLIGAFIQPVYILQGKPRGDVSILIDYTGLVGEPNCVHYDLRACINAECVDTTPRACNAGEMRMGTRSSGANNETHAVPR